MSSLVSPTMPLTYRLIITSALVLCVGISDALLLLTTANHRTPIFPKAPPPTVVLLQLARHNNVYEPELLSVQQIVKTIGVLSLGASILVMNAGDASAASAASSMRKSTERNDPRALWGFDHSL